MRRPPKLCRNGDRAYVTLPGSKDRKYLGKWGTPETQAAYEAWLARHLVSKRLPEQVEAGGGMIVDMAKAYLAHAVEYYGGKSSPAFRAHRTAVFYLLEIARDLPTSEIRGGLIAQYQQHLMGKQARRAAGKNLSRRYINTLTRRIKRFIRWGVANDCAPPEAYQRVATVEGLRKGRTAARERPEVLPVPLEAVQQTLPCIPRTMAHMLLVQLLCGMRPSEARLMRWEEIDRSGDVWLYRPQAHKNRHRGQSLVKGVPQQARDILEARGPLPSGYVFRVQDGSRAYAASTVRCALYEACDKLGIQRWSPNQLRHTIATHVKKRHGWAAAQSYLGHADLKTTEIYAEEDAQDVARVARLLEGDQTLSQLLP